LTLSTAITLSGTVALAIAGRGTQTITSAGRTFTNPLLVQSAGSVVCADALTVTNTLTLEAGVLRLKEGVTSAVTTFVANSAIPKTLNSAVSGSQATFSQSSGSVSAASLTIQDIVATGGATWTAYVDQNNVNAGNNTGWNFGLSPTALAYEVLYEIRSFTQPRRF
jgi:hypothetical protein